MSAWRPLPDTLPTWHGEFVRLRPGQAEDIEFLARARVDDHETMRQHGDGFVPPPPSRHDIVEELTRVPDVGISDHNGDDRNLVVARRDDDLAVGTVSVLRSRPQAGAFWLAVTIFEAHRRQGYARDAVKALLRAYFDELRYHKANAAVFAINAPSHALFRGLGFLEEGRLRETRYTEGQHGDELIFGITAAEFRAHCSS